MNEMLPAELAPVVADGERVLWTGRAGRVGPGAHGIFGGCFGLVFGGFALFWIVMAAGLGGAFRGGLTSGNPGAIGASIFPLFGVPFFLVGAYIVYTYLFAEPRKRGSGVYAVTDRRLLFIRTHPRMTVKEIPLSPHLRVEQTLDRDGGGTLAFLDPVSVHDPEGITVSSGNHGRRAYRTENPYTFYNIPDAAQVAHLVAGLVRR